jgi:hypothetical protein
MVEWLAALRRGGLGSQLREQRPALRAARRAVRRAMWRNRALVLARRGELAAAERAYARSVRAARARFEAAEKARLDALQQGRAAVEALRAGRKLATFGRLSLYPDRLELPHGAVALSPEVTAVVGVPSMLAAARPEAILRLGATKDERRLLKDLASAPQRTPYLFIESRSVVAAWRCAGEEEAAEEFAARVNVAALNAEQAQRDLREHLRSAEQELWRLDAEFERAALEAFTAYQERRADTQAVDRARRELDAALGGGEEIERLRAGLVRLASE